MSWSCYIGLGNLSRLFIYQLELGSYFNDIRSINDSGRPWEQIQDNFDKNDYACLKPLIEHVFVHHAYLLLWNACSDMVECLLGCTGVDKGTKRYAI